MPDGPLSQIRRIGKISMLLGTYEYIYISSRVLPSTLKTSQIFCVKMIRVETPKWDSFFKY